MARPLSDAWSMVIMSACLAGASLIIAEQEPKWTTTLSPLGLLFAVMGTFVLGLVLAWTTIEVINHARRCAAEKSTDRDA